MQALFNWQVIHGVGLLAAIASRADNMGNHYSEHRAIISFQKQSCKQCLLLVESVLRGKALAQLNPVQN